MKNSKTNVEARQQNILKLVRDKGEVHSDTIAEKFNISIMTVRRDLKELEQKHLLRRTHGGAISLDKVHSSKNNIKDIQESRNIISEYAANLIQDGDSIFINGSKTALKMLDFLGDKNVTVYTNNGLAIMKKYPSNISIRMTGGELRNHIMVGEFTMRNLLEVSADRTFIGCEAVYNDGEFQYNIPNEIGINEAMISRTKHQLYILADHSKLQRRENRENSYGSCSYDRPVTLITDKKADPDIINQRRSYGMEIIIV